MNTELDKLKLILIYIYMLLLALLTMNRAQVGFGVGGGGIKYDGILLPVPGIATKYRSHSFLTAIKLSILA